MPSETFQLLLRLRPSGVAWLDRLAEETGRSRSEVIRQALGVAKAHEKELLARLDEFT